MLELFSAFALAFLLTPPSVKLDAPTAFESNSGQLNDSSVRFVAHQGDLVISFKGNEIAARNRGVDIFQMRWIGVDAGARLEGFGSVIENRHYFIGSQLAKWHSKLYGSIGVHELYPGIDVFYSSDDDRFNMGFMIAPGADANVIRFELLNSDSMKLDGNGDLVLGSENGFVRVKGDGKFRLDSAGTGHVEVESRQSPTPVTVKNEVEFWSSAPQSPRNPTPASTQNRAGTKYVAAQASLADLNSGYGSESHLLISEIRVDKPACSAYIAGNGSERPYGIATDGKGDAYVTGDTGSDNFPTTQDALQAHNGGAWDAFVVRINATCDRLTYSSYLGGADDDRGRSIAVDRTGRAFVAGYTKSANFPGTDRKSAPIKSLDAFVSEIAPDGKLQRSVSLGGRYDDYAFAIALDESGNPFVAGQTNSPDFHSKNTGSWDGFVAKLDAKNLRIRYVRFLGGRGTTYATAIAVDKNGSAYVSGYTNAADFPVTKGAAQPHLAGAFDAFVTKLDGNDGGLLYSTYLGGNKDEEAHAITIDDHNSACITGESDSPSFAGMAASTTLSHPAGFVICLDPEGSTILQSQTNAKSRR